MQNEDTSLSSEIFCGPCQYKKSAKRKDNLEVKKLREIKGTKLSVKVAGRMT